MTTSKDSASQDLNIVLSIVINDSFVGCEEISVRPILTWTPGNVKRLFSEMKCLRWTTITSLYVKLWIALSTYYSTSTRFAASAAEELARPSASTTGGATRPDPETSTTGRKQICEIWSWRETISIWDKIKTLPHKTEMKIFKTIY